MRVLLPAHAQDHRSMSLGSFTKAATVATKVNPTQAGGFVVARPASSMRGAIMAPYRFGRTQVTSPTVARNSAAVVVPKVGRGIRWGLRGLGEEYTEGGEPLVVPESMTVQPASTPSADPGFDWSKLATSVLSVGGGLATTVLQNRYARPSSSAAPVVSITQTPSASSGISTKTLVIAGVAVAGLIAVVALMRK